MKKKLYIALSISICIPLLALIIINSFINNNTPTIIDETSSTGDNSSEIISEPPASAMNYLTGLPVVDEASATNRPVAVMINNIKAALPQYGIEAADIMYELPVEGGITRMMAVYSDYTKVPKVCSVRSCRYYYPLLALGMDAVYIHWGCDMSIAWETLKRTNIERFDGGTLGVEFFGRDSERVNTYSYEHTGYLDGSRLPEAFSKYGYRTKLEEGRDTLFSFNDDDISPSQVPCNTAVLNFSSAYFSTFVYDQSTKTYKKQHSGEPHIDSSTGNQLEFKNVIALQTNIQNFSNSILMNIDLTSGTGKYISNGFVIDIKWSKADDNSPVVLTNIDGTPLNINKGKSYIAFIGYEKSIAIS